MDFEFNSDCMEKASIFNHLYLEEGAHLRKDNLKLTNDHQLRCSLSRIRNSNAKVTEFVVSTAATRCAASENDEWGADCACLLRVTGQTENVHAFADMIEAVNLLRS